MTLSIRKILLWLAFAVACAYGASFNNGYHFDDSHSVEANVAVRSLSNIPSFWLDSRTSSFIPENRVYRPMVYTLYSFCWQLGGGATWPFHLMKMGMHMLVALALYLIWARLWSTPGWFPARNVRVKIPFVSQVFTLTPEWAALFLASLFAIHPATSECAIYISATTSLQCAMFYVWAFWCWMRFRDSSDKRYLAGSLALYFFSVASKEEGITLPAMIAITELFLSRRWADGETVKAAREKAVSTGQWILGAVRASLPYWILFAALGAWIVLMRPTSGDESRGWVSSGSYFITQWRAYLWYMRLWFWPWDLNADVASMEFSKSILDPLAIQAAIGNLVVIAFAWLNRKRYPAMLYGLVWFYVTISPASSFVVLAEAINEHRMYLAYIGFVGGTFAVVLHWCEVFFAPETRATRLGWILALIVIGFIAGAWERDRVWATDEALWLDTVEKNPTSGRAMNNLALVYLGRGEWKKAVEYLEKCEQFWSSYMYCPLNKAVALQAMAGEALQAGKKDESTRQYALAEASLQRAYLLNPRSVHNNFHLGKFNEEVKKDYAKAAEYYRTSVELTGWRYPAADLRLGAVLLKLNRKDDAQVAFERAASVEPDPKNILFETGKIQLDGNQPAAAAATYAKLVAIDPRHLQAWYNLGVASVAIADFKAARTAFERTVELDPRSEQGWFNLSFVDERLGDGPASVKAAGKLVEINPQKADFQARLRDVQKKFGAGST